jgi:hypothetical protein
LYNASSSPLMAARSSLSCLSVFIGMIFLFF